MLKRIDDKNTKQFLSAKIISTKSMSLLRLLLTGISSQNF
jgi:hypothetical protein